MGRTIFLALLILCAILSEGIKNLSEANIKHLFDLHIRKKRLVDLTRKRSRPVPIENYRFIVSVQKNGENVCGASILSPTVVITAAHCLQKLAMYWILSGSSYNDRGIPHNITRTIFYPGYRPEDLSHDLVLLIISPAIDLEHSPNRKILLYDGDVAPGTPGTITGWGSTSLKRISYPTIFRSITVPVISQEECRRESAKWIQITDKNICTWNTTGKLCCNCGDSGAPLVVHGRLAGVFSGSIGQGLRRFLNKPDVFMNVANPEYRSWIVSNIIHHTDNPYNPLNSYSPHLPCLPPLLNLSHLPQSSHRHNTHIAIYNSSQ